MVLSFSICWAELVGSRISAEEGPRLDYDLEIGLREGPLTPLVWLVPPTMPSQPVGSLSLEQTSGTKDLISMLQEKKVR